MISRLDPSSDRLLLDIARSSERVERARREISSGKRLTVPSDGPDQVSSLLQSRSTLSSISQMLLNLSRVKTEVDSAESAVSGSVRALERARVAGLRGASTLTSPETRGVLADEIGQILEQVVAFAGTSVEGRYVFSGDTDQTAPFTLDWNNSPSVSSYLGSAATRATLHPSGITFSIARSAGEIFDSASPGQNVFQALEELRNGLLNNDAPMIESGLLNLKTAADYLNSVHAFYGIVQRQVNETVDDAYRAEVRLKTQIAAIEDADIMAAALDLSEANFSREAALAAHGQSPRKTLFDYIG
jgi:flagellar hook-associated protein 3 FlgL